MKKSKFTESQIIKILKEAEAGTKVADLAREHGVSAQTIYNWRAKYGGLEVNEAKRFRELEEQNRKLKQMVADLSLDKQALKEALSKKW
jgi:putative transposase